jgi:hypothetical protein
MQPARYDNLENYMRDSMFNLAIQSRYVIFFLPIFITLLHYFKSQDLVVVYYMIPSIILGSLPLGFSLKQDNARNMHLYLYSLLVTIAYGVTSSAAHVVITGSFEIRGGPAQLILVVAAFHSFHVKFRMILIRNVLLGGFMIAIALSHQYEFGILTAKHVTTGFIISSLMSHIFHQMIVRNYTLESTAMMHEKLLTQSAYKSLFPHQVEMIKAGYRLEDTIDTSRGDALIVELDIKRSSLMLDENYEAAKKQAFATIYQTLFYKNYQINPKHYERPYANAYKIKELGDGFIFAVGHPFTTPPGEHWGDIATMICIESTKIIKATFRHFMQRDVNVAFAISRAEIKPFWTSEPACQLDFEQEGIVKISRLSELRRELERQSLLTCEADVILMDEKSQALMQHALSKLVAIELSDYKLRLRNYPQDRVVYFLEDLVAEEQANSAPALLCSAS